MSPRRESSTRPMAYPYYAAKLTRVPAQLDAEVDRHIERAARHHEKRLAMLARYRVATVPGR